MREKRKPSTFRFTRQTQEILARMTAVTGLTRTAVIERALREAEARDEANKRLHINPPY